MSNYQKLLSMKDTLQALRKELNGLKKAEESDENLARINAIEKNARELSMAIRVFKTSHGFAA